MHQFCITLTYLHLGLDVCTQCQLMVPCYMAVFMMSQSNVALLVLALILYPCCHLLSKRKESMSHENFCISSLPKRCLVIRKLISSSINQHWVGMRFIACCRKIKYEFLLTYDGHFFSKTMLLETIYIYIKCY